MLKSQNLLLAYSFKDFEDFDFWELKLRSNHSNLNIFLHKLEIFSRIALALANIDPRNFWVR